MRNKIVRRSGERGANLVEFGLSFLLFFTVLCGIMEFGRAVAYYNILAGATKEGARYAMAHGSASGSTATASDIQNVVRKWAIGLDPALVNVTTTWASGNGPGGRVNVRSRYNLLPFTALVLPAPISIGSSSELIISQ
ncbi:MAG TPA: TadE/TadG family type IV pilus assembly protein [Bryobacteraceae bacterium]|nr:TadE/TadG family type IV pilus assembly protein [Bryobacteraceae bacterium]